MNNTRRKEKRILVLFTVAAGLGLAATPILAEEVEQPIPVEEQGIKESIILSLRVYPNLV